jgi:hypothetical protein
MPAPLWDTAEPGAGGAGDPDTGGDPAAPGGAKWWEGETFKPYADMLTAKGFTTDDPLEAMPKMLQAYSAAEKRLGKPADQLMDRPGKDQTVPDWMRANGEMFGIPESAEKYEITQPESWPKDAQWNTELEQAARTIAHEEGVSNSALQRMIELYAGSVQKLDSGAAEQLEQANAQMMEQLQKDWGQEPEKHLALAQQAASVLAEKAGLSPEQMANVAEVLKPKTGDAGTMRLFAAIGQMMSDDSLPGLGDGGAGLSTTPADARAQLSALQSPGGEYFEAVANKDRAAIARLQPKIDHLTKIAAG